MESSDRAALTNDSEITKEYVPDAATYLANPSSDDDPKNKDPNTTMVDAQPWVEDNQAPSDIDPLSVPVLHLKDDEDYNLDKSSGERRAIVFNHLKYHRGKMSQRDGTEFDVKEIKETFGRKLGFKVEVHEDPTNGNIA